MPRVPLALALLAAPLLALADDPAPPETFDDDQRSHWAYQVPSRPDPPEVARPDWARNPIDRFILAELEAMEFEPAPEADRVALLRRITFDLTGLPPTPEEVDAFLADESPDAYETVVDRLLASARFGERWAQHWLDLAHYADSNGFELDAERPDAWRYRDWVVSALNDDMPYDRFLALQLAGDEVAPGDPEGLIATGFGRCGPREVVSGNLIPEVVRQSELTGVTGTVGSVFLGLTLACARCHDHKFDALPTTDYYRLQAFFAGAKFVDRSIADDAEKDGFKAAQKAIAEKVAPLRQAMADLEAPYRKAIREAKEAGLSETERAVLAIPEKERTPQQQKMFEGVQTALKIAWEEVAEAVAEAPADHAERERLKRAIHEIEITLPRPPAKAMALLEPDPEVPETRVYRRGEHTNLGPRVEPRPPGVVLASMGPDAFPDDAIRSTDTATGRRRALAEWLARPDNPLTARVIVNRLWQHHFGRGIVATPSDFGVRGEAPSHPELLDWLAVELVEGGWTLKRIHRLMVTSAAYRQSSDPGPPGSALRRQAEDDPDNTLVWRMNRRRMEAESLRDAMLAASGELNPKMGGPGVLAPIEKEVEDLIFTEAEDVDLWPETPDPAEQARRSLYLFRKRNVRYPMFDAFDAPDTQTACPKRDVSTHALQSLVLLNGDFALGRAKSLAGRTYREAGADPAGRVRAAYRATLAREPRPGEVELAARFLESQADFLRERAARGEQALAAPTFAPEGTDPAEAAAWVDFCLAMLNRNEFVYVP